MNMIQRIVLADEIKQATCYSDIDVNDVNVTLRYLRNGKTLVVTLEAERVVLETSDGIVDLFNYGFGWMNELLSTIKKFME